MIAGGTLQNKHCVINFCKLCGRTIVFVISVNELEMVCDKVRNIIHIEMYRIYVVSSMIMVNGYFSMVILMSDGGCRLRDIRAMKKTMNNLHQTLLSVRY